MHCTEATAGWFVGRWERHMRYRRLGQSELELSVLGLGAWAIGGAGWTYGWGPQDDRDSIRAIQRALELGINWIDTAAVYGMGHAEEVVGRALEGRTDAVVVATKCGLRWRPNGAIYPQLTARSVREEVEASLRRLKREAIDLYQIHWPRPEQQIEEAWRTMGELVREGKVRYAGVSNFSAAQLERARAIHPVTSLQPPYSMVDRQAEAELLPYCAAHQIGVIAYSPLQCGLLTGTFSRARLDALDPADWRRRDRFFKEPTFSRVLALVERLRPIATRLACPVGQVALAWVLRRPEVTAAIVGARSAGQIEQTAPAGDLDLDADAQADIALALQDGSGLSA